MVGLKVTFLLFEQGLLHFDFAVGLPLWGESLTYSVPREGSKCPCPQDLPVFTPLVILGDTLILSLLKQILKTYPCFQSVVG